MIHGSVKAAEGSGSHPRISQGSGRQRKAAQGSARQRKAAEGSVFDCGLRRARKNGSPNPVLLTGRRNVRTLKPN